jgi:bifunctional non-homologous end joining protein LigD
LFEVKWDGYRGIATVKGGEVALQSRSGKSDLTEQFPEIVAELSVLPDCVIDGELAVLDDEGNSSFESMDAKAGASYVVFDVLEVAGHDVRGRPLDERRKLLEELLKASGDRICVSPAFDDGEALLAWAAAQKVEGIVAKRRTSTYREGSRTEAWLKIKLRCEQEFAVVGWKPGEGAMAGAAGSLLLAVFDGAEFAYVGRVGTGCSYDLWQSFTKLPQRGSSVPIDLGDAPAAELRDVVWVEPELVVQVRFQRWTVDGRLWHPSVVGVRTDKLATDCRREVA